MRMNQDLVQGILSIIVCIGIAGVLLYFSVVRTVLKLNGNKNKYQNFKGPKGYPLLGNCLEFLLVHPSEWIKVSNKWHRKFGSRYRIFLGNQAYITFTNAADVQKVLSSKEHNDKSADYDLVMPWLGTGLLTSKGQKWFHRRKLLTPAFHYKILEDFVDVFNEQSMVLVETLQKHCEDGEVFNIFPYVTRCALDIICETAMGKKVNAQRQDNNTYADAVYRISELIQHRMVRPWLHPNVLWRLSPSGREEKRVLAFLHGFTEQVIAEKQAEHSSGFTSKNLNDASSCGKVNGDGFAKDRNRVAFLDMLVTAQASGLSLTDLDIREETDTFMFEGHDSVAASANWAIFLLGGNPDCQEKVQRELDEVFGSDSHRPVTTADLSKLKYLECCIKEALRLYPSVPFIGRAIKSDLELDADTTVSAGSTAFITLFQLHRDPTVFPDPEKFLPERFFPENLVGRHPFAYVPFSAGQRNCIGQKFAMMEEKVMLANLFRRFNVEAAERREDLILLAELIMRPMHGLHIKLTQRP